MSSWEGSIHYLISVFSVVDIQVSDRSQPSPKVARTRPIIIQKLRNTGNIIKVFQVKILFKNPWILWEGGGGCHVRAIYINSQKEKRKDFF